MREEIISNDYDISKTFSKSFANIAPNLKIIPSKTLKLLFRMKQKINRYKRFSFCTVSHNEILKQIKNLDTEKEIRQKYFLTKMLKPNFYFISSFFHKEFKVSIWSETSGYSFLLQKEIENLKIHLYANKFSI